MPTRLFRRPKLDSAGADRLDEFGAAALLRVLKAQLAGCTPAWPASVSAKADFDIDQAAGSEREQQRAERCRDDPRA
jgi:hypothetical protein